MTKLDIRTMPQSREALDRTRLLAAELGLPAFFVRLAGERRAKRAASVYRQKSARD